MAIPEFRVVGYQTDYSGDVNDIRFDNLTHINYAFALPDDSGDGSLQPLKKPEQLHQLSTEAHKHGVKVMISVGGWNDGNDQGFEKLAADTAATAAFIANLVRMVEEYDLDGVDMDWEYPGPEAGSARNFANLIKLLSDEMHCRGKLLTAAVVALGKTGEGVLEEVFGYVDFLTIMAYDGGDGADHSPYSYAENSLYYWLGRGLPKSKAVLGVPFYGRPAWGGYNVIVAKDPEAPYKDTAVADGTTVYYNGLHTIKAKTRLALEHGSGVMIWELSHDTTGETSLLNAITEAIQQYGKA